MVFSSTTDKNGLIQRIEQLTGLGDAGVSGNATLLKIVTGNVNNAYDKVVEAILKVDKNWKWDDFNYTNFPRATETLVAGQKDYTLPAATAGGNASTLLRVNKICVLDTNSTANEVELWPTNLAESELNDMYQTNGKPVYYKLIGNSVKMWPAPDAGVTVTLANGLVIYFQRTYDPFTSADTTQQPGFQATYHELLAYGAAATYLLPSNARLATSYLQLFNGGLEELQESRANQNQEVESRIIPRYRSSR